MYKKLFVSLSVLALASCTETTQEDLEDALAKPLIEAEVNGHHVSYSDVVALTRAQNSGTRAYEGQEPKIECITNSSNDTLLYIHQKPTGGWTIYSSDTRVPSIVAESDEGTVEELMQCASVMDWIKWMSEDMETISKLSDDKLKFSKKEMNANRAFWKSVSSSDEYVKDKLTEPGTRAARVKPKDGLPIIGDLPPIPNYPGHYELDHSSTRTIDYDTSPRLTTTNWHQGFPYNSYCPNGSPAGCVAIAGAQMLYFLHYKLGVPQEAPVGPGNNGVFNNYSSTIWDTMDKWDPYKSDAAPLIADVGRLVGMDYGYYESGANTADLPEDVFEPYGISCTYTDYNTTKLRNSLGNGMPVILRASADGGDGHAFICDRYKRTQRVTYNTYIWKYDVSATDHELVRIPSYTDTIYSTPIINEISMNWGWGKDLNKGWYTLTGDWVDPRDLNQRQNWKKGRHMIYDFKRRNNN